MAAHRATPPEGRNFADRFGPALRYGAAFVLPLLLAAATALVFDRVVDRQEAVTDAALRSDAVLDATGRVETHLLRSESAQRGFALSGDPRFRQEYAAAVDDVHDALAEVEALDGAQRYRTELASIRDGFASWRSDVVAPTLAARARTPVGAAGRAAELEARLLRLGDEGDAAEAAQLESVGTLVNMLTTMPHTPVFARAWNEVATRLTLERENPGSQRETLRRLVGDLAQSARSGEQAVAAAILYGRGVNRMDAIRATLASVRQDARSRTDSALQEALDGVAFARAVGWAAPFVLVVLGFAALFVLQGRLVGSVRRLTTVADRLAAGDADARVRAPRRDPLVRVGHAFDAMADRVTRRERLAAADRSLATMLPAAETVDEALDVVAEHLHRIAPTGSGTVARHDPERDGFEVLRAWGEGAPDAAATFSTAACWAARRSREHRSDLRAPRCGHVAWADRPALCLPLDVREARLGVLTVAIPPEEAARPASDAIEDAVRSAAEHLALTWAALDLQERLRAESIRDPLTGLYNRRYLEEATAAELARSRRDGRPVAAIFLDLDRFKRLNDTFGHVAGDEVLAALGRLLAGAVRPGDVAARYGGEEFVLLLPEADRSVARARAESLRTEVHALRVDADVGPLTASFGVALAPDDARDRDALFAAADAALYRAKRSGRDRVVAAGDR